MATNNITGDQLISKANSKAYADNYDRIFSKQPTLEEVDAKMNKAMMKWESSMKKMINDDMAELDQQFRDKAK